MDLRFNDEELAFRDELQVERSASSDNFANLELSSHCLVEFGLISE